MRESVLYRSFLKKMHKSFVGTVHNTEVSVPRGSTVLNFAKNHESYFASIKFLDFQEKGELECAKFHDFSIL